MVSAILMSRISSWVTCMKNSELLVAKKKNFYQNIPSYIYINALVLSTALNGNSWAVRSLLSCKPRSNHRKLRFESFRSSWWRAVQARKALLLSLCCWSSHHWERRWFQSQSDRWNMRTETPGCILWIFWYSEAKISLGFSIYWSSALSHRCKLSN